MFKEHTLCNFSSLKNFEICFNAQDLAYHGEHSHLEKNACSAIVGFYIVNYILLLDYISQVFYIYVDFMSSSPMSCWEVNAEVSSYKSEFFYFSFQLYQNLPWVFWSFIVWCIHTLGCCVFLVDWFFNLTDCSFLFLVIFFVLKSSLSDFNMNKTISTFLYIIFLHNICVVHLFLSLYSPILLNLKSISCKLH